MAKKSMIAKNEQRRALVARHIALRLELKEAIRNPKTPEAERDAAWARIRALPRDSNPNRVRLRCQFTGRPRGNYRKFGICRNALRQMVLQGDIPGMRKASW